VTGHVFYSNCAWCGTRHDRATNATDGEECAPVDGDATVCFACGEWLIFEHGYLRRPTAAEFIEIGSDDDCRRARAAWVFMTRTSEQFTDSAK